MHQRLDSEIAVITPPSLKRVFQDQRHMLPNDADALDRLFHQLELNRPMLAEIRDAVADFYCIEVKELSKRWRITEVVVPRQIFCYLAYRYTRFSLDYVGRYIGLANHTTVMHAIRRIERLILTKPIVADDIDVLRLKISEKVLLRRRGFAC
jgi:chromosomal replication initiator protein